MKTYKIKQLIKEICRDGAGIVTTDNGNGSGGPGFVEPDTLSELLSAGEFDDAEQVAFDESLARESFGLVGVDYDADTAWIQIEFSRNNDGYHHIAWIWDLAAGGADVEATARLSRQIDRLRDDGLLAGGACSTDAETGVVTLDIERWAEGTRTMTSAGRRELAAEEAAEREILELVEKLGYRAEANGHGDGANGKITSYLINEVAVNE